MQIIIKMQGLTFVWCSLVWGHSKWLKSLDCFVSVRRFYSFRIITQFICDLIQYKKNYDCFFKSVFINQYSSDTCLQIPWRWLEQCPVWKNELQSVKERENGLLSRQKALGHKEDIGEEEEE